jgi:L-threonylcarbamoyladenylate synthase
MKILTDAETNIAEAVTALTLGEVIAYPAETLYGLGVDPLSEEAIDRLYEVKGRPESNPIPVIVADEDQMLALVKETSIHARQLIDRFWPGPLSLVMPKASIVPDRLTAGRPDICVRCPASPIARGLCAHFGRGITSTSANRSGEFPVRALIDLNLKGVAVAIDAGELDPGRPSTIYDVKSGEVLREGEIGVGAIQECLAEL